MAVPPEKILELSDYPFSLRSSLTPKNQTSTQYGSDEQKFTVRFPEQTGRDLPQDQEWMEVTRSRPGGAELSEYIRFHEYDRIYRIPGLYEHVFHRCLQCRSPEIIANLVMDVLEQEPQQQPLRLLDVGAGCGLIAEALNSYLPLERIIGVDIIKEARLAAERDRPGLFNEYMVADLTALRPLQRLRLLRYKPNLMTCIAALGFGDIPVQAFRAAFNAVRSGGLVAVSIRDSFLERSDQSGFAEFLGRLEGEEYFQVKKKEQFLHRYSVDGREIYYYAIIGKKVKSYE